MPDIREILNALDIDNRALWSEQRTIMRRSYLNAHNQTVGMGNWSIEDDAFLDLIDIRLALLFDRAGLLHSTKEIIGNGDKIEQELQDKDAQLAHMQMVSRAKRVDPTKIENLDLGREEKSDASKKLEGFASDWAKKDEDVGMLMTNQPFVPFKE